MYQYFVTVLGKTKDKMHFFNYVYAVDYKIDCMDDIKVMKETINGTLEEGFEDIIILNYQILSHDRLDA